MSVVINIESVIKRFGKDTIVNSLSLNVWPSEFFTLLGPSGCGKTTLLCMIIGFNSAEGDEIRIDGKVINSIPTNKRNIGVVFQNYITFSHMSARDDVAFGLRNKKMPQVQIESQVDEILEVVKTDHLKKRVPLELSGDQQQHVALARAIVIHPEALLMDEPLSNLDARLRVEMRSAIKRIQQQVDITTLYVTHDQEEALVVSDRITVMNRGVTQRIDTPKGVYQRTANLLMPIFIELSDTLDGTIEASGSTTPVRMDDYAVVMNNLGGSRVNGQPVKAFVRPKEFILDGKVDQGVPTIVRSSVLLGVATRYFVKAMDGKEMEAIQNPDMWDIIPGYAPVRLRVQPAKISVYDQDGSESLVVRKEHS